MTSSPRTGADVLGMVVEALRPEDGQKVRGGFYLREALAALNGCIVLTAEEAGKVLGAIGLHPKWGFQHIHTAVALLTPTDDEPADSEWNEKVWAETGGPC